MAIERLQRTRSLFSLYVIGLASVAGSAAAAERLSQTQARAVVTPFYEALSAVPDNEVATLVKQATAHVWTSCGGNDECKSRDEAISAIAGLHKLVPDLRWEIRDLLVAGNQVIVRGEATGTPSGDFSGVPYGGRSFKVMSIDVHTIEGGKMVHSYHVEDWRGATRQLSAR